MTVNGKRKQRTISLPEGGTHFVSSHVVLLRTKTAFHCILIQMFNYTLGIISASFGTEVRMIVSPLEKMKRP